MRKYIFIFLCSLLVISASNADLLTHWELNQTSGNTAIDTQGNMDGTIGTENKWEDGALYFTGQNSSSTTQYTSGIKTDASIFSQVADEVTLAFWAKINVDATQGNGYLLWAQSGSDRALKIDLSGKEAAGLFFQTLSPPEATEDPNLWENIGYGDPWNPENPNSVDPQAWNHYAFTKNTNTGALQIFINGQLRAIDEPNNITELTGIDSFPICGPQSNWHQWAGWLKDFRIYNNALTEQQVYDLTDGFFEKAYQPDPRDGGELQTDEDAIDVTLTWKAGNFAVSHNVYFGTDETAVENATETSDEFIANQLANEITFNLEGNKTYYWRVDEVNDIQLWPGEVWSFTIEGKPEPTVWWEMDSEDDYNLGQDIGGATGRTYITNKATGEKASGLTATDGIVFDEAEGALYMDGVHPCRVYGEEDPNILFPSHEEYTFTFFAKADLEAVTNNGYTFYLRFEDDSNFKCDLPFGETKSAVFSSPDGTWCAAGNVWNPAYPDRYVDPESWNMYTFVWSSETGSKSIYINGVKRASVSGSFTPVPDTTPISSWGFGDGFGWHGPGGWYKDYRVYNEAISEDMIIEILGDTLLYPGSPDPKNQQTNVALDKDLSWNPGNETVFQNIYFGTDITAVENADTNSPQFRGQIGTENNTYDPGQLSMFRTYYWRIDQLDENGQILVKGRTWRFSTIQSYTVDDFEAYDLDGNDISDVWTSPDYPINLSLAQDPVQNGVNSMKLVYSNNLSPYFYSEAKRSFSPAQDWTRDGVKVLSLSYYGDETNHDQPLYVTIETTGGSATVVHPDPEVSMSESWNEWNINLTELTGLDLTQVTGLIIGTGDGENSGLQLGQQDEIFIDDILLYPSRCIPEYGPTADLTGDCKVNYFDLAYITQGWLKEDTSQQTITDSDPVGLWLFDNPADLTQAAIGNDLTVNGSDPVAVDGVTPSDGAAQIAVGSYYSVNHGISPDANKVNEYTLLWDLSVPTDSFTDPLQWIALAEFDTTGPTDADLAINIEDSEIGRFGANDTGYVAADAPDSDLIFPETWYQLVVSVQNGNFFKYYINGRLVLEGTAQPVDGRFGIESELWLFKDDAGEDLPLDVSTFAIWDRALTSQQIAELLPATLSEGDLNDDTEINFLDFALLADQWMQEILWP